MILQAYILKYLFFGSLKTGVKPGGGGLKHRPSRAKPVNMSDQGLTDPETETNFLFSRKSLLEPTDTVQKDSLCSAMTEILWKVGDRSRAVIVIPCLEVVIDPPLTFTFDGVTEKVD